MKKNIFFKKIIINHIKIFVRATSSSLFTFIHKKKKIEEKTNINIKLSIIIQNTKMKWNKKLRGRKQNKYN